MSPTWITFLSILTEVLLFATMLAVGYLIKLVLRLNNDNIKLQAEVQFMKEDIQEMKDVGNKLDRVIATQGEFATHFAKITARLESIDEHGTRRLKELEQDRARRRNGS